MSFVPNLNAVRYVLNLERGDVSWVNVMFPSIGGAPDVATLNALAQNAYGYYAGTFLPILASVAELVSVDAYGMSSTEAPVGHYVPAVPTAGGVGGEMLPLQCAGVVTWRTGGRGRSARGRSYISGWAESSSSENALTTAARDALQTAANAFWAAFLADEHPLCVYSQYTNNAPRPLGLLFPVTAADVRTGVFGSQRDRNHREATA